MVRAVQASASHEVRSSRAAEETLQHDQGRLCDRQEEGQGQRGFRLQGERTAFSARESTRSSQRTSQASWVAYRVETKDGGGCLGSCLRSATRSLAYDDPAKATDLINLAVRSALRGLFAQTLHRLRGHIRQLVALARIIVDFGACLVSQRFVSAVLVLGSASLQPRPSRSGPLLSSTRVASSRPSRPTC